MNGIDITQEQANYFVANNSMAGLYAIYAFNRSFENKIAFDRLDFVKEAYKFSAEYFYGFIVGCNAFGALKFNFKGTILTPIFINPLIVAAVNSVLSNSKNEEVKENLEKIDTYFKNV